jgi:hypothetical protein
MRTNPAAGSPMPKTLPNEGEGIDRQNTTNQGLSRNR